MTYPQHSRRVFRAASRFMVKNNRQYFGLIYRLRNAFVVRLLLAAVAVASTAFGRRMFGIWQGGQCGGDRKRRSGG